MANGNQGAFLPSARRYPPVLCSQIRVFRFGSHMGNFDEDLSQPAAPFAGLATEPLASTFRVARAHPRPRGKMLGTGKTAHIGPNLRNQDLGRPLPDPGNRVEEGDGLLVRR